MQTKNMKTRHQDQQLCCLRTNMVNLGLLIYYSGTSAFFLFTDNPIVIISAVHNETNQTPPPQLNTFPVTVHTEPDCKKKIA